MEMISRKQAAKLLGVSINTLDKWRKEKKIGYYQPSPGCKVTFLMSQIEDFLAQNEHRPRTTNYGQGQTSIGRRKKGG